MTPAGTSAGLKKSHSCCMPYVTRKQSPPAAGNSHVVHFKKKTRTQPSTANYLGVTIGVGLTLVPSSTGWGLRADSRSPCQ